MSQVYRIFAQFKHPKFTVKSTFEGADRAEALAKVEANFNASAATSYTIISEGFVDNAA